MNFEILEIIFHKIDMDKVIGLIKISKEKLNQPQNNTKISSK